MMTTPKQLVSWCVIAALVCLSSVPRAEARIVTTEYSFEDRAFLAAGSFGYEPFGQFFLDVTNYIVWVPNNVDSSEFKGHGAFVLERTSSDTPRSEPGLDDGQCFSDAMKDQPGFDVWILDPLKSTWSFNKTIEDAGYYHLYFVNCYGPTTSITMNTRLEQYNMEGSFKNYLSAGESSLPTWYFFISGFFVAALVVWVNILRREIEHVRRIHWLMTVVIVFKILSLLMESADYHAIKTTGEPHGWNVAFYVFYFIKSMLMFAVIVLIGTGWSYMKPFLTDRDKQIIMVVLVVQMMTNIAMIIIDEYAPGSTELMFHWRTWLDILHLLDMVCCCFILLPIVWSIRHLREAADADGKAARNVIRLKRFRKFYLVVVSYIYFTRIIVYLMTATLPFELTWLGVVFGELANLAFYITTGYLFRPQTRNPYLALDQDEDAADQRDFSSDV